ncbi:MAG: hypothetical protein LW854_15040 [Rubrivivax sp.]|nr:hypothetical protein [Rubrivivax sp.]
MQTFQQHLAKELSHRQAMPHPQAAQLAQAHHKAQAERFAQQASTHAAFTAALAAYRAEKAIRVQPVRQGATQ